MSEDWIAGLGGQFDVYAVRNAFESALIRIEARAEKKLAEFDFTKYNKTVKATWYRKGSVTPLFAERMPASIAKAVRLRYDVDKEILDACLLESGTGYSWQSPAYDAANDFNLVAYDFGHVRKIKSVIRGLQNAATSLTSIYMTDEAFEYYSRVITFINYERNKDNDQNSI